MISRKIQPGFRLYFRLLILTGVAEPFAQSVHSICEDTLDVRAHQPCVNEKIERHSIPNAIAHDRSAIAFSKRVLVNPLAIWAANLFIDETMGRFPLRNFGPPSQRKAAHPKFVINQRSITDFNRRRRKRSKTQPRRRNRIKIRRISEKVENFVARTRQPKLGLEFVDAHIDLIATDCASESDFKLTMDSINQNQPEPNRADLRGADAIKQAKELIDKAQTCFFCTTTSLGGARGARPMSVQEFDDAGNLWFLSADDSHKNEELERDPNVTLYFQGSAHSNFLMLRGAASISRDKEKIKQLWEPIVKTWFTEGVDDPRITVIKVAPTDGYYWDTKHGGVIAGAKMLVGAAIGKTLDDSIEGQLKF